MSTKSRGSCLCGAVTYEVTGALRPVCACHCTQCRKSSGHYVAATQAASRDLKITGESLTWFKSSESAERGFCATCGSNLFWRRFDGERTSIMAGTLEGPTGLVLSHQLYVESAGDYYDVPPVPVISQDDLR